MGLGPTQTHNRGQGGHYYWLGGWGGGALALLGIYVAPVNPLQYFI